MKSEPTRPGVISAPIVHKTLIRASRAEVFSCLATAEGFDRWFTSGTTLVPEPGGKLEFVWKNWGAERISTSSLGVVREHEANRRFVFQWWMDSPTTVELTFEDDPEGTLVTVRETGYLNSVEGWERCLDCATGWGEALTLVKFYLEAGATYR